MCFLLTAACSAAIPYDDCYAAQVTGKPLPAPVYYGKPNPEPYRLMEALLRGQAARLGLDRCTISTLTLPAKYFFADYHVLSGCQCSWAGT